MKLRNVLRLLLSINLLGLLLSACAVKPPDVAVFEKLSQRIIDDPSTGHIILKPSPVCMKEIGEPECGHGTFIMSGKEIYVGESDKFHFNGKSWKQVQKESIYVPAMESYGPLSEYMINSCEKNNCSKEVQKFKIKIDSLKEIGDVINPSFSSP